MTLIGQAKLASRVREEVRDRIRDGRFSDGVQLPPEVELATSLGVSRTTVREALLQLEQEGLLDPAPRARDVRPFRGPPAREPERQPQCDRGDHAAMGWSQGRATPGSRRSALTTRRP